MFNKSLSCAEIPADWKFANVIPIPKTVNRSLLTSYRPIYLLCTCAKSVEHIIFNHISAFLNDNAITDARRHGFRRGFSTVTQLVATVNDLATVLDRQGQIDLIFLDFEKAFDGVSHAKLLVNLKPILKSTLIDWIEPYLSSREQCVQVNDGASAPANVDSGIPQGPVLGPLFLLAFINDGISDIRIKIKLFADDSTLYNEIRNSNDQEVLNTSLSIIQTWCSK